MQEARDAELEKEEARDAKIESTGKALSIAKVPYEFAMCGKWEALKKFYKEKEPDEIVGQLTTNNDTALHVAAFAGRNVLRFLISQIKERQPCLLPLALKVQNIHGNTVLHEVAASGNLEAAKHLLQLDNTVKSEPDYECVLKIQNKLGETPLYRAAAFGQTKVVEYLAFEVEHMDVDQKKEKEVEDIDADQKKQKVEDMELHFKRKKDKISILHIAVISQHFETALWLLNKYPDLAKRKESNGLTSLQWLAQMPSAFEVKFRKRRWTMLLYKCIYPSTNDNNDRVPPNQKNDLESMINQPCPQTQKNQPCSRKTTGWRPIDNMFELEEMQNYKSLSELTDLLVEEDYSWAKNDATVETKTFTLEHSYKSTFKYTPLIIAKSEDNGVNRETGKSTYKYTPLLIATCTGISQIVEKILKAHPQAVEAHDIDNQQNIMHMAIKHRRLAIFNILEERKLITSRLVYMIDSCGNTILHHAADTSSYSVDAQRVSGPAFQLQEELRWMARVKKIMPPHYAMHKNNNGVTAEELFEIKHSDLLKLAKTWIKETAQSCSTVAALVATVAYAAAFTAPGGNDNRGVPVLGHSPFFITFAVSDTISLICSLTSLGTFLSILTSPFEYENFHHSLPSRLHLGFALLFLSLVATMLTFTATIVLLIHHQKTWTTSLIYVVAFLPVSVFGLSQFPLYDGLSQGLKYISRTIKKIKSPE